MSIVDAQGEVVASYEYDPYGNVITATGTLAEVNPIRYRGYYFDAECNLYYLQSRYYDPAMGRFINADAFASTGQGILGNNMFAYCNNNPIARADPDGEAFETVFDALSFAVSAAEVMANPSDLWAWASLSGDFVDLMIPFAGGLGETVRGLKAAGYADEVADALDTIATTGSIAHKGKVGELLADITTNKGKPRFDIDGRTRIPDAIRGGQLVEVKNVASLSNTSQLKDFMAIAQKEGLIPTLCVRPGAHIATTVLDAGWNIERLW